MEGAVVDWKAVGTISKGITGEIEFTPARLKAIVAGSVIAEKLLRQKAENMVRVGEDQRTSVEMKEMLNQKEEKKNYWWAYALIVGLLTLMFIGWYFSEHGVSVTTTMNTKKSVPQIPPPTYKMLP
jgi:hypothetical protein